MSKIHSPPKKSADDDAAEDRGLADKGAERADGKVEELIAPW